MTLALAEGQKYKHELLNDKGSKTDSVADYVVDWYETQKALGKWSPLTEERVWNEVSRLRPYFENVRLCDLGTATIEKAFAKMRADGVSEYSVGHSFKLLKRILKQAYGDELISRNPCDTADIKEPARDREKHREKLISQDKYIEFIQTLMNEEKTGHTAAVFIACVTGAIGGGVGALGFGAGGRGDGLLW